MIVPPDAGKSLLSSCLPSLLPGLTPGENLEVSVVQSVAGALEEGRISRTRPSRAPHHSASMAALTSGAPKVKPGEVSPVHLGLLSLDALSKFQSGARLAPSTAKDRQGRCRTRHRRISFPARVQLVAAMNPCSFGHLGDPALACSRAPRCAADYQIQVSGP